MNFGEVDLRRDVKVVPGIKVEHIGNGSFQGGLIAAILLEDAGEIIQVWVFELTVEESHRSEGTFFGLAGDKGEGINGLGYHPFLGEDRLGAQVSITMKDGLSELEG